MASQTERYGAPARLAMPAIWRRDRYTVSLLGGLTEAENAVWNWVEKHPPDEKPLTEIVSGFILRPSSGEPRTEEMMLMRRKTVDILLKVY